MPIELFWIMVDMFLAGANLAACLLANSLLNLFFTILMGVMAYGNYLTLIEKLK